MNVSKPAAEPRTGGLIAVVPSVVLPMFMGMIGETIVATALPGIAASLGGVDKIAWVVVAYMISMAVTAPVYGRLGDAYGRRRMMVIAIVLSLVGSVLCALATSMEALIAARAFQGMGGGGLISLSHALVGQAVPPRDRIRFHSYIAAFGFSASALGPVIGGLITESLGWQYVFLFNLPFGLVAIPLVFRLPARLTPFEPFRFDLPGLVLLASFICALLVMVEEVRQPAEARIAVAAGLATIVLLAAGLLVVREKRASDPLFPPALMVNPTIWRCDVMAICHGAYFVGLLTFTPIYLRVVHGLPVAEIGFLMFPMTAAIGVGSFVTGQVVSRTGRSAIFPSVGLTVVAGLLIMLAVLPSLSPMVLSAYLALVVAASGTVMGVVGATTQTESGPKFIGTATGVISLCRSMGGAAGSALAGALLFAILAANGVSVSTELQAIFQGTGDELASLGAAAEEKIRSEAAFAFRGVFLLLGLYAAVSCYCAWTLPRRRI